MSKQDLEDIRSDEEALPCPICSGEGKVAGKECKKCHGTGYLKESAKLPECNLPTEGELSPKVVAGNLLKRGDKEHWTVQEVGGEGMSVVKIGEPGSEKTISWDEVPKHGFVKIGESSVDEEVDHGPDESLRVVLKRRMEKLKSAKKKADEEYNRKLADLKGRLGEGKNSNESKNPNKDLLNSITDQKVSEAIAVAERDIAISDSESIHLQYILMQSKLNETIGKLQEAAHEDQGDLSVFREQAKIFQKENASVIKVLEDKAKILSETKEALTVSDKELSDVELQLSEAVEKLEILTEAHKKELADSLDAGIIEGRQEVLKDYLEDKLSIHRLQIDDNSRTLLESCQNLQDVDSLMDKLIGIARKSALHSKPLTKVQIQEKIVVDPQEDNLDNTVGHLMERMG